MAPVTKICRVSGKEFVITDEDQAFYEKMDVPMPTLCPEERQRRRFAHRNERNLYHRKCDLSGKSIISVYSTDKPYKVFDQKEWWGDKWNPLDYGRDFDFSRSFFEQFNELRMEVPRLNLLSFKNENSDYTNNVTNLRNCYLLFSSDYNEDCYYGVWLEKSKNSVDNYIVDESELAYECFYSQKIYRSIFIFNSSQCSDSAFLYDCKSCSNCFMSYGLRNKQYYIENKQYTKEEYKKKMDEYNLGSNAELKKLKSYFEEFIKNCPRLYMQRIGRVESSTGDFLIDCNSCIECSQVMRGKDCKHVQAAFDLKDAYDCSYASGELGYENCECAPMPFNSAFNTHTYTGQNLYYCDDCMNGTADSFGCVSLKRNQYCILNKQYTKEEYELMKAKIIEHMKKTGEWGEFFPISISPFAYNETNAAEYFPLTKEEALTRGYKWKDEDENQSYQGAVVQVPDTVEEVTEDFIQKILTCEVSGKLYKIIPQEFAFYKKMGIPLPLRSPEQRHKDRMEFQNPRKLWDRKCETCVREIQSTYAPERSEKVYCEDCYLKLVY